MYAARQVVERAGVRGANGDEGLMQFDQSMRGERIERGHVDLLTNLDLETPFIHLESRIGIETEIWDSE